MRDRAQRLTDVKLRRAESEILDRLADAWNAWCGLGSRSPDDDREFQDAIHRAQTLVALRVARRADPQVWRCP